MSKKYPNFQINLHINVNNFKTSRNTHFEFKINKVDAVYYQQMYQQWGINMLCSKYIPIDRCTLWDFFLDNL